MQITLYFRYSFLILGLFLVGVGSAWGQEQEYRPMLGSLGNGMSILRLGLLVVMLLCALTEIA